MIPPPLTPSPPWQARWVWLDPAAFPEAQTAPVSWWAEGAHAPDWRGTTGLLRCRFDMPETQGRCWLRVSADSCYRLWINGRFVGRGPAMVGGSFAKTMAPDWWYHDWLDISECLHQGENVIAAEVLAGPDSQTLFSQGHAGFIAEILDDAGTLLLATGPHWRGIAFTGYRPGQGKGFTRDCDLRAYPPSWQQPGFDDQAWPALVDDPTLRPALCPHGLPPLCERFVAPREGDNLSLSPGQPPVRLEFDRMLAGHLCFSAQAGAGTSLEVVFEEIPGETPNQRRRLHLTLPEGDSTYASPAYFSARTLLVSAQGASPVHLRGLGLMNRSQAVEDRGSFACSDPFLTELWQVCRHTLRLCLQDIHLDSPHHQESLGDHGDYLIEMLMAYYAFGDYALAHVDVERMARDLEQQQGAQFHTSYALLFPDIVADLLLFTGDQAGARAALPAIRLVLQRMLAWRGDEGLLSQAPNYMFVDWIEHGGSKYHHPPAAQGMGALTAFAVRALRRAAWLIKRLQPDSPEAEHWNTAADGLAGAFRACLYDADKLIYRDGLRGINRQPPHHWLPPDGPHQTWTRHTNILAVWSGIITGSEAAAVLRRSLADPSLPEPQPYFQHYLFEALVAADLFADCARPQLELWREMLTTHPYSLREMWTSGDHSHAWGGTPLIQLSRRILGVEPLEPGWRTVRVDPQPLDLTWAHGTVPTPHGDLTVSWQRQGSGLAVEISAPQEVTVHRRS